MEDTNDFVIAIVGGTNYRLTVDNASKVVESLLLINSVKTEKVVEEKPTEIIAGSLMEGVKPGDFKLYKGKSCGDGHTSLYIATSEGVYPGTYEGPKDRWITNDAERLYARSSGMFSANDRKITDVALVRSYIDGVDTHF